MQVIVLDVRRSYVPANEMMSLVRCDAGEMVFGSQNLTIGCEMAVGMTGCCRLCLRGQGGQSCMPKELRAVN